VEPFPTTLPVYSPEKTVFSFLPYPRSSDYERQFMSYLDRQEEVVAFTKVFRRFPVQIPYRDASTNAVRHYTPDFLIEHRKGLLLGETKGGIYGEDPNVSPKARAASRWCKSIRENTSTHIEYLYVSQQVFDRYKNAPWDDLISASKDATP